MSESLRIIRAIAQRELISLFVTPLAYVVGALFLLDQGWNFALLLRALNDPLAAPGPVMQYYFGGSFFIFWLPVLFLCSTVTMRLVAEEAKQGTLEALLTAPVRPIEVIVGKFIAAVVFYVALWVPTGLFYVLLWGAGVHPDIGPIAAGYLGTLAVGAMFLAVGIVYSTAASSQLAAALGTFVTCSISLLAGLWAEQMSASGLAATLRAGSLLHMMEELSRGVVDGRWWWMLGSITVVALGVAVTVLSRRRTWESWLRLALLAVCGVYLTAWGARVSDRADWTGGRMYTVSERAGQVLRSLAQPVDAYMVMPTTMGAGRPNPVREELAEVLRRMVELTPSLRVHSVDPDRERERAEQLIGDFGVAGRDLADGVLLIRASHGRGFRHAHLLPGDLVVYATGPDVQRTGPRVREFRGEEAILGKLLEVSNTVATTVCHSTGNGEYDLEGLEPFSGYAHFADLIRDANMTLRKVVLDEERALVGCDLVVVARPTGTVVRSRVDALRTYLDGGGSLLVLAGAVLERGSAQLTPHGLEPLLAEFGVRYGDRLVLDPHQKAGASPLLAFTVLDGWGDHPAVRSLIGRPVSFVTVRELSAAPTEGTKVSALVSAPETSWAEQDLTAFAEGREVQFDAGEDRKGPIPLALASERGAARVVVVGSDQLAANANLRPDVAYDHARDFLLNTIGWLTRRDALLGIRPKPREHVKLVLLPAQLDRMAWVCIVGLPLFAILLGALVLWGRRR